MVKSESKILSTQTIFEKDDKGSTNNALLYQDILKYPIKSDNKEFKLRSVGNWLLEFNDELIKRYDLDKKRSSTRNIPKSKRFANIRDRLEAKIEDLIQLGLLSSGSANAEKVDTQIPIYSLTGDGYFITLLLQRNESPYKMTQLYDFILSNLRTNDSYHNLLFSRIYQKCKDKGMLETVFIIIEEFLASQSGDRTIFDAILSISQAETYDRSIQEKLRDIRLQALMELDELGRASYLLHVKSSLEEIMIKQHPPKRWEEVRLAYYNDYSTTVMYAWCHDCVWEDYVGIDIMEYIKNLTYKSGSVHAPCPECHGNNLHASTSIPHHPIKLIFHKEPNSAN